MHRPITLSTRNQPNINVKLLQFIIKLIHVIFFLAGVIFGLLEIYTCSFVGSLRFSVRLVIT